MRVNTDLCHLIKALTSLASRDRLMHLNEFELQNTDLDLVESFGGSPHFLA